MLGMTELWQLSAGELARLIREREASSREVVDAHLDRIDAVNGRVNAIVEVLAALDGNFARYVTNVDPAPEMASLGPRLA